MNFISSKYRAKIVGSGMCVPDRVVSNKDLAALMDTSDEWIQQRSGIKERRHVDDGTKPSDLAFVASKRAFEMAGCNASDIDLIVLATLTPEHYFPGTGAFLQAKLGVGTVPVIDIRSQCSGFIYGLSIAESMIVSGKYRRILLVGVEVHSRGLDFTDRGRDVAVLFGDGAGAVVVERTEHPEAGILSTVIHHDGQHAEKLWVEYPTMGSVPFASKETFDEGKFFPKMDGKFVFKNAVQRLPEVIKETLGGLSLNVADIDQFLFHQANLRINEFVAESMGIPQDKAPSNIQRYGNCSSASIPMLLDENLRDKSIRKGSLVCMAAFGAGFTWGSAVVRF